MSLYPVFANWAKQHGLDAAMQRFSDDVASSRLAEFRAQFVSDRAKVAEGGPLVIAATREDPWYSGPTDAGLFWPPLKAMFKDEEHWPDERVKQLDGATNKVVAHTPRPDRARFDAKGLVVGYVQSGKTTNFTSVIAKMADEEYRLVIVLSGIHNGLRKQTQQRLNKQLWSLNSDRWVPLTTEDADFKAPAFTLASVMTPERRVLAVVKKNAAVLKRLIAWVNKPQDLDALKHQSVLIIDDEADQASVATGTINPLVRRLLGLFPKSSHVGYTATPFANVFIDPKTSDDLYPKDFILNLPRPEGYFGPEKIFGRDAVEGEDHGPALDGYDMVRMVPEESIGALTPLGKQAASVFSPTLTDELLHAIRWFWLATAARRARGDTRHSTMLIHTSVKTEVHEAYRLPLETLQATSLRQVERRDLDEWRALWDHETSRVPREDWGAEQNSFEEVERHLADAIRRTAVVLDNYKSADRLIYTDEEPVVAIAVGGNTLSRGLTLEGLVVSFFIRTATAYDTLLQMGRWFGFRTGYEDLPRIWMTEFLESAFRHLATVEHEMRADIEYYQLQNLTPLDVAVRIRTHPILRITAKMGAAQPVYVSFAGRRLQTRYFYPADKDWLEQNLEAARKLVGAAALAAEERSGGEAVVFKGVNVGDVFAFLDQYTVHPESPDIDFKLMKKYIEKQVSADSPSLQKWNIAVMSGDGADRVDLGPIKVRSVVRSQLDDQNAARADIKTLMSRPDRVVDMDISATGLSEAELVQRRNEDPAVNDRGLLVIYPIERMSSPKAGSKSRQALNALETVIGVGFVFPGEPMVKNQVTSTAVAVDLTGVEPTDREDVTSILNSDSEDPEVESL